MPTNGNGHTNGTHTPPADLLNNITERELAVFSVLADRARMAAEMGQSFNGLRNYYDSLGYPKTLTDTQLYAKYKRDPLAGRAVDVPAGRTWKRFPHVLTDGGGDTFGAAVDDLAERFAWMEYCRRTDILSSIGRYALLFIGTKGEGSLEDEQEQLSSPDDILYLNPYHSSHISDIQLGNDPRDARYRLPIKYKIQLDATMDNTGTTNAEQWVHHTRVIHVAQNLLVDDVYGSPLLESLYNDLDDALKVRGASAEAIWRLAYQGMTIEAHEGVSLADTAEELKEKAEEYLHGLNRVLAGQGVDYNLHGGSVVDPSGMWGVLKEVLSAGSDIPSRIFFGSERGSLASTQDEADLASTISTRQTTFAEPRLLRPLIDFHIKYGALAPPPGDKYVIRWHANFELNALELAQLTNLRADALTKLNALSLGLTPEIVEEAGFSEELAAVLAPGEQVTGVEQ